MGILSPTSGGIRGSTTILTLTAMAIPMIAPDSADDEGFDEELVEDLVAARADGLAQADLAGSFGDRDQHDVHDADAADDQGDHADEHEDDGEGRGDFARRLQNGREVLHRVDGAGGVAALEQGLHGEGGLGHAVAGIRLGVEGADEVVAGVVLDQAEGNEHGLRTDLGLAEGGDALAKDGDDGKGLFADAELASDHRSGRQLPGQFLGDQAAFGSGGLVEIVEEAAFEDEEVANLLEALGDSDQRYRLLLAVDDDAGGHVSRCPRPRPRGADGGRLPGR